MKLKNKLYLVISIITTLIILILIAYHQLTSIYGEWGKWILLGSIVLISLGIGFLYLEYLKGKHPSHARRRDTQSEYRRPLQNDQDIHIHVHGESKQRREYTPLDWDVDKTMTHSTRHVKRAFDVNEDKLFDIDVLGSKKKRKRK